MTKPLLLLAIASLSFQTTAIANAQNVSVTIDGKTYTCSGSGAPSDCSGKAQGLAKTLEACMKSFTGGYCANEYWPKYKSANPNCISDGVPACLDACTKSYTGGYCAGTCQ